MACVALVWIPLSLAVRLLNESSDVLPVDSLGVPPILSSPPVAIPNPSPGREYEVGEVTILGCGVRVVWTGANGLVSDDVGKAALVGLSNSVG